MALEANILADLIAKSIPLEVKKRFPDAKPQPFQVELATACAKGFVMTLKSSGLAFGGAGLSAIAPGFGITGITVDGMVAAGMSEMGSSGVGMEPMLRGVYTPVITYLKQAQISSISGFGGQATGITGVSKTLVAANILAAFGSETQKGLTSSSSGEKFLNAIAAGFADEITKKGIPGFIPMAGITPGPIIGKIS